MSDVLGFRTALPVGVDVFIFLLVLVHAAAIAIWGFLMCREFITSPVRVLYGLRDGDGAYRKGGRRVRPSPTSLGSNPTVISCSAPSTVSTTATPTAGLRWGSGVKRDEERDKRGAPVVVVSAGLTDSMNWLTSKSTEKMKEGGDVEAKDVELSEVSVGEADEVSGVRTARRGSDQHAPSGAQRRVVSSGNSLTTFSVLTQRGDRGDERGSPNPKEDAQSGGE
eukprot:GHVN01007625.1.p1 GENE.GHVN01007625.1~~GHVN01007625.1.p1  ORF type:complete len:223 (-),score=82.77 GHVN01007625.1:583-1251(-)